MPTSKTEIANRALSMVHGGRLTAFDEDSELGRMVRDNYAPARDVTLELGVWNIAARRVKLPASGTPPAFGFANAFDLPTDPYCLRVRDAATGNASWHVEGRQILTNAPAPLAIVYTARIDDPTHYPPLLAFLIATKLAELLVVPLSQTGTLAETLQQRFLTHLPQARSIDAQEGTSDPFNTELLAGRV